MELTSTFSVPAFIRCCATNLERADADNCDPLAVAQGLRCAADALQTSQLTEQQRAKLTALADTIGDIHNMVTQVSIKARWKDWEILVRDIAQGTVVDEGVRLAARIGD